MAKQLNEQGKLLECLKFNEMDIRIATVEELQSKQWTSSELATLIKILLEIEEYSTADKLLEIQNVEVDRKGAWQLKYLKAKLLIRQMKS